MKQLSVFAFLLYSFSLSAQQRATGMLFDPPSLRAIQYKAQVTTESYGSMPSSASLEKYCPVPGDQGSYSTCVAFATAYHLRTIMHTKLLAETAGSNPKAADPNRNIFSPSYIYEQIKEKTDINCQEGTNPVHAFELMKKSGSATLSLVPYRCGTVVKQDAVAQASKYSITDYQVLFYPGETDKQLMINSTKKALSEGYPLMLGFIVAESFYSVKGDVWREQKSDDGPTGQHGRHAMCVVGYDNNKYGGAFRVMNSWGVNWADRGFVWIPYKDFTNYALMVIQAYGPKIPTPDPRKPVVVDAKPLKGSIRFQLNTGETMKAARILTRNLVIDENDPAFKEELVAYRMEQSYTSGTRFRFHINTNTDAYIYAFATDLTGKVNQILPFADNMSPYIGSNSTVAFPSEKKVIKMDDNPGTDYLLILYSNEKLDAAGLLSKMNGVTGGLTRKIKAALGDKMTAPSEISYHVTDIGFDVKSGHKGTVVPVMVELSHR